MYVWIPAGLTQRLRDISWWSVKEWQEKDCGFLICPSQQSHRVHWWLPPFHYFLTNIYSLSADSHTEWGNKLQLCYKKKKKKKCPPMFDLLAHLGHFMHWNSYSCGLKESSWVRLKLCKSASHKWVKPFPQRGGFPAPHAECGLTPEFKKFLVPLWIRSHLICPLTSHCLMEPLWPLTFCERSSDYLIAVFDFWHSWFCCWLLMFCLRWLSPINRSFLHCRHNLS